MINQSGGLSYTGSGGISHEEREGERVKKGGGAERERRERLENAARGGKLCECVGGNARRGDCHH